jgi:hypothetical protein
MTLSAHPSAATDGTTYSGSMTYYDVGLGACGYNNNDGQMVVAMPYGVFDPSTPNGNPNNNALCGQTISIGYNGKWVGAEIVDRCKSPSIDALRQN